MEQLCPLFLPNGYLARGWHSRWLSALGFGRCWCKSNNASCLDKSSLITKYLDIDYLSGPQHCYEKCIMRKFGFCKASPVRRGDPEHQFFRCVLSPTPGAMLPLRATPHSRDLLRLTYLEWGTSIFEVPFFQQRYCKRSHTKIKMPLGGLSHWWHLPVRMTLSNGTLRKRKTGNKDWGTTRSLEHRTLLNADRGPKQGVQRNSRAAGEHFEGLE